jgi:hypothetical protein
VKIFLSISERHKHPGWVVLETDIFILMYSEKLMSSPKIKSGQYWDDFIKDKERFSKWFFK